MGLALLLPSFASAKAQTVDVVGDSVSVILAEAGTLRETLIDNDVSFSSIKRIRIAGPINSKELKFFAENTVSGLETIDIREVEPVYDDEKYASVNVGRDGGIIMSFLFSDKHTVTYTGHIVNGMFAYMRDLYDARVDDLSAVFSSYKSLKTLMLPKWLTRVGASLASNCEKLTNVVLPSSVASIGCDAFYNCSSLESLSGAHVSEVSKEAFALTSLKEFYWDKLKKIGRCTEVDSLLEGYTYLGAFYGTALTSADLGKVDSIPEETFLDCEKLSEVTFSRKVEYIGDKAFARTALKNVGYGDFSNLKYVGAECFNGTPFLKNQLTSDEAVAYCGKFALQFKPNGKGSYTIKDGTVSVCDYFCGDSYYGREGEAYTISLPSSIKSIGKCAFTNGNVTKVNLPEGLEYIGESAFSGQKLTSITLPSTLKKVGKAAFYNTKIERLAIPDNDCVYEENVFSSPDLVKLDYYYNAPQYSDLNFSGCSNLTIVNVGANVTRLPGRFCAGTKVSRVNIEEHAAGTPFRIQYGAFSSCENLKEIVLPSTTDSIGGMAFYGCPLKELKLPDSLKFIGEEAFYNCPLKELMFPSGLNYIGGCAFFKCPLYEVNLPNSVAYVGYKAFVSDAIKKVTIPGKVANFESAPFSDCKNVTDITFNGIRDDINYSEWFPNGAYTVTVGPNVSYIPACFQHISGKNYRLHYLTFAPRDEKSPALTLGTGSLYCFGMTRLELPEGTETIEDRAIGNCKYLRVASIPSTVKKIVGRLFNYYECKGGLDTIYSFIPCDPDIIEVGFGGEKENGKTVLCVMPQYLNAYRSDTRFSNYEIIAMPEDHIPVGINNVMTRGNSSRIEAEDIDAVYDTKGRRVESLRPGLNIVRTKDGRMVKIMSK